MTLNEFNGLQKNFDNKIMTFPSTLETLGGYCTEVKTDKKSQSMEKQAGFKLHVTLTISVCKFVAFSFLL